LSVVSAPAPTPDKVFQKLYVEEEIEEETGVAVKYPLDQKGAEILLITPSADFFAEPHIDGLIGYGKVFHQDGVSWQKLYATRQA
jgi:hypothetical protein